MRHYILFMVFIFNTKLPPNDRLLSALKSIFGLGNITLIKIKKEFGLTSKMLVKNLRKKLKNKIINFVEKNYVYGQELRMQLLSNEIKSRNLRNYVGMRKRFGLPVRGQKTNTNSRTTKKKNNR